MRIGDAVPGAQGSFGIPAELKAAGDKFMARGRDEEPRPDMVGDTDEEIPGMATSDDEMFVDEDEKKESSIKDPLEALTKLGIYMEDEDFHKILFKGFVEKDVAIVKGFRGVKGLNATFKTLTVKEYDLVDELLAEEYRETKMTNDGFMSRRSLWILAFGITKLQGRPLPVVFEDDAKKTVDDKATAKARRAVLGETSHGVINRMIHIHGAMTLAIENIINDPEAEFLKKS